MSRQCRIPYGYPSQYPCATPLPSAIITVAPSCPAACPPGPAGTPGAPGLPGAPGAEFIFGEVPPPIDLPGAEGDVYVDTITNTFYQFIGGEWVPVYTIANVQQLPIALAADIITTVTLGPEVNTGSAVLGGYAGPYVEGVALTPLEDPAVLAAALPMTTDGILTNAIANIVPTGVPVIPAGTVLTLNVLYSAPGEGDDFVEVASVQSAPIPAGPPNSLVLEYPLPDLAFTVGGRFIFVFALDNTSDPAAASLSAFATLNVRVEQQT